MGKISTCYIPFHVNNLYADNVKRILGDAGYETIPIKKALLHPSILRKCKIFNFNWYETVKAENKFKERVIYEQKKALINFLKLCNKKIVYTIHNNKPHNLGKNDEYSKKMMKFMMYKADAIVCLCPDTYGVIQELAPDCMDKTFEVLHPNYIYNYRDTGIENKRVKWGAEQNDLVLLFLGFITPYKKIEILIDAIKQINDDHVKLVIAGNAPDFEYKNKILKEVENNKNIIVDFRYIPDEEIPSFYQSSDIVILPYSKVSALNSGAVYLSFSMGRTVICPDIGTVKALKDQSFVYHYDYNSDEEHKIILSRIIQTVYKEYKENPNIIKEKGEKAYLYMKDVHSDSIITSMYKKLYDNLLTI